MPLLPCSGFLLVAGTDHSATPHLIIPGSVLVEERDGWSSGYYLDLDDAPGQNRDQSAESGYIREVRRCSYHELTTFSF